MRILAFCLMSLAVVFESHAALWHVWPDQSIQSSVNQAADGDTVLIHDGDYVETTVLWGRRLVIGSEMLLDGDTSHTSRTIIEPDFLRPDTGSCFVYAYQSYMATGWWESL